MNENFFCFVLMPFSEQYRNVYDHGIFPAVQKLAIKHEISLQCFRADNISKPGSITRDIVEAIYKARIIVADLTDNNPNVFYELGVAHTIGNKTIMMTKDIKDLPFDLRSYRVITYETSDSRFRKLQRNLVNAMEEVLIGGYKTTNPVQDYAPIKHQELISDLSEVLDIETRAKQEIWIIGPNVDIDIQFYTKVMRDNIVRQGIKYKYILPHTKTAQIGWSRLETAINLPQSLTHLLQLQYVKEHEIESEIVLYDPYTNEERIYLMPPVEEKYHFYFQVQGSRAIAIRQRFEKLWKNG